MSRHDIWMLVLYFLGLFTGLFFGKMTCSRDVERKKK